MVQIPWSLTIDGGIEKVDHSEIAYMKWLFIGHESPPSSQKTSLKCELEVAGIVNEFFPLHEHSVLDDLKEPQPLSYLHTAM